MNEKTRQLVDAYRLGHHGARAALDTHLEEIEREREIVINRAKLAEKKGQISRKGWRDTIAKRDAALARAKKAERRHNAASARFSVLWSFLQWVRSRDWTFEKLDRRANDLNNEGPYEIGVNVVAERDAAIARAEKAERERDAAQAAMLDAANGIGDLSARAEKAEATLAASEAGAAAMRCYIDLVVVGYPHGNSIPLKDKNCPGHYHSVEGIWDLDNKPHLAGRPCAKCVAWNAARATNAGAPMLAELEALRDGVDRLARLARDVAHSAQMSPCTEERARIERVVRLVEESIAAARAPRDDKAGG